MGAQGKVTHKHSTKHRLKPWCLAKAHFFTILVLRRRKAVAPHQGGGAGVGVMAPQPPWPRPAHRDRLATHCCSWPPAACAPSDAESNSAPVFLHSPGFLVGLAPWRQSRHWSSSDGNVGERVHSSRLYPVTSCSWGVRRGPTVGSPHFWRGRWAWRGGRTVCHRQ